MECYYRSQPSQRGYRRRIHEIWRQKFPQSTVTEQQLLSQKRSIEKNGLLTNIEMREISNHVNQPQAVELNSSNTNEVAANNIQGSRIASDADEQVAESEQLTDEQIQLKEKISQYMELYRNHADRPTIRKVYTDASLVQVIQQVNVAAAHVRTANLTELNALLYAAAKVIEESVTRERCHHRENHQENATPPWKRRLESKISIARTEVNRLKAAKEKNGRIPPYMFHKYHMDSRSINEVLEDAKQRLIALSHRLRRYEKRNEQFRINKQFRSNPQKVYRQFKCQVKTEDEEKINAAEMKKYWQEIWERPVSHNHEAGWLSDIETKCEAISPQQSISVTGSDIKY